MRVLHIGKFYPPDTGGVETATRQAVEAMAGRGITGGVLCFDGGGDYDPATDARGPWPVRRAPVLAAVASQPLSPAYVRLVRTLAPRFDLLHVHMPNPLAALALFLARPRTPIVLHWHSDVIGKKAFRTLARPLETWLCRRAEAVIGPTAVHLESSDRAREIAAKGVVVPFCVDASMASPDKADPGAVAAIRERFGGRRIVFALGRLVPYKGFDVLIEASGLLPPDAVTVIGGGGPLLGEFNARVAREGLSDRVRLVGRIPDAELSNWFAACDVFCLPSVTRAEMFGIVQLEAMAFGKPVVSTAIPRSGVPRVNLDGQTGLVAPPGDVQALAGALSRLLGDRALAKRLGDGGRAAVAGPYSPPAVAQGLLAAYERALPGFRARLDSNAAGRL